MGFTIEDDLNTENSRAKWLEWKRRTDPLHYLSPKDRQRAYRQVALDMIAEVGPGIGVPALRPHFPQVTRAEQDLTLLWPSLS